MVFATVILWDGDGGGSRLWDGEGSVSSGEGLWQFKVMGW